MKTTDSVSPELRNIENEVDNFYKSNPLMELPFATAAWYLLVYAEEYMLNQSFGGVNSIQDVHSLGSDFITEIEHSMIWIYRECEQNGQIPYARDNDLYKASKDLFELSQKYDWFMFAYTCASGEDRVLDLELQRSTIQPTGDFFDSIEYEAYNILIDPREPEEALMSLNPEIFPTQTIQQSLKVKDDRFNYKLNPKMVSDVKTYLRPLFDKMFLLPSEWNFTNYTLGDFQKVFEAICAMAHIHWAARIMAWQKSVSHKGYIDSVYVISYGELIRRVSRYSDMPPADVRSVLDDLTYGSSGIDNPIPALQPLIKLNSNDYVIAPNIWICSSAERNITALLNRMSSNEKIYSKLSNEQENLMKERITIDVTVEGIEFISANIPNLTDIDLSIVNHTEKACLLLELKWFNAPTTAKERIHKSKEIKGGISQILKLKQAFADNHKPLLDKLNIDSSYRVEGVVVSENWIGYGNIQSPDVPVIRSKHLIEKLKATDSIKSTMDWLNDREYLPKEGVHFNVHRPITTIGNWNLKWFGIKPLIKDAFFPL